MKTLHLITNDPINLRDGCFPRERLSERLKGRVVNGND